MSQVLIFAICSLPFAAQAQTGLKIQLVSEQTAIVPGKPFTVGLYLEPDRGWHIYWRYPGIVGVPAQMQWKLPHGWKAGELIYPEPERTLMFKIKAQGHDRDVMLRTEIMPPENLKTGGQVTLTGMASWMCCKDSCYPGTMELSLTLPVADTAGLNSKWHKLLERERGRAERTSEAWSAAASEKGAEITLSLKPVTAQARASKNQGEADKVIVFTEDGWFDSDKPQTIKRHEDGSLTITLLKADTYLGGKPPKTLRAILRNDDGWVIGETWRCLQIAPTIER
ncbi:MAG: hypothetical protein JNM65_04385 [Verrucomicrobiaceae bacterium]|nr:hypothetical protein [Verrucomicrobiaceae bacterium]